MKLSKWLGLLLAVSFLVVLAILGVGVYIIFGGQQPPPAQPIAFSHRLHAEEKEIACVYCHPGANRAAVAGLPSVEKCMGCHRTIATDKPEVRKVAEHWENKQSITWARVNYLPDHVRFTHQQHVVVGELECRICHGTPNMPGGSFARLQPGMAWCLDCHRQRGASIDCATCHK